MRGLSRIHYLLYGVFTSRSFVPAHLGRLLFSSLFLFPTFPTFRFSSIYPFISSLTSLSATLSSPLLPAFDRESEPLHV